MRAKILKLKPDSRFHFGKPLIDSDTSLADTDSYVHSDVLFSALVNNLATTADIPETVDAFVNAFCEGKLKISSGFYCIEKTEETTDKYIFLLPRPANLINLVEFSDYDRIKRAKKVEFITPELLNKHPNSWYTRMNFAMDEKTLKNLGFDTDYRYRPSTTQEHMLLSLFHKKMDTLVGLRSKKQGDNGQLLPKGPYNVNTIQIADLTPINLKVHFYFLYEILDARFKADFELAVALLQYNGIGGERSSGCGQIESVEDLPSLPVFFEEQPTNYQLSLSKIIPQADELEKIKAYTHTIRGGRHSENGYLKSVRMINEGSVIAGTIAGKMVDISPENSRLKYIRNGKVFSISLPENFKLC